MCEEKKELQIRLGKIYEVQRRLAADFVELTALSQNLDEAITKALRPVELQHGNGLLGALCGAEAVEAVLGPVGGRGPEAVMPLSRDADGAIEPSAA